MSDDGSVRRIQQILPAMPSSDGAGVKILRSLGQRQNARLDPFLMLDEIYSDDARDYLAGFPSHPHRGFETVTYMREGHMLHEDHLGNKGDLRSGGAQWMTAGRGIIHSEMPQQESGRMHGFQLWINLPAREKMKPASYKDLQSEDIPGVALPAGGSVKVIAGTLQIGDAAPVPGPIRGITTDPILFDVTLPAGASFRHAVAADHNAFVYVYAGGLRVGPQEGGQTLRTHSAGLLTPGTVIELSAGNAGAGVLVLAARPLNEPVVQYGPFVMNTVQEIEQAIRDYQRGELTLAA
jgi:redox-sensitive bicupin YhaK (pirin superfamily)